MLSMYSQPREKKMKRQKKMTIKEGFTLVFGFSAVFVVFYLIAQFIGQGH